MVVDPKSFLQYAIRKQNKISHVPCEALVFAKDEIPENIQKKIADQYSEDFLADAAYVLFEKGPIDKKLIKKIFKATDKALGEEANKLTEGDFKLLKMKDDDQPVDADDSTDEAPDSEIDEIVNNDSEPEDAEEDEEDPIDVENEEAIADVLDDEQDKDIEESEEVNEAGLSLDDILKKGNDIAAKRNAEAAAKAAERNKQEIKSIWIKSLDINLDDETKSTAQLQITYSDGKVEDVDFPIGTTGEGSQFAKGDKIAGYVIPGEKYSQGDASYKAALQNLKRAFAKYGIEPTDEDVRISLIRQAFNDWRIKWMYGPEKKDDPFTAFSRTQADVEDAKLAKKILSGRGTSSKLASLRFGDKGRPSSAASKGRAVYSHGNTTIYKVGEAEEAIEEDVEDNSLAARMHQGKSMAQWEKDFKGEFDIAQLWRMASSGCDLQKLLLQMNNIISFEDSEKPVNEAKEDKEEKDDSSDEEKKDDGSSEEADDSDNGDSEEAEEEDKPKPTGVANENPNVPTKWIFLKITLKK